MQGSDYGIFWEYVHIYIYIFYMYIFLFFLAFFSMIDYYKILNKVPCTIQENLVIYLY